MIAKELDLTGETLNNYKIISRLGRGGMATVYKAHELSLNRFVALKVLSSQLSEDKEYIKRFQREAQSAAQLNHPNIVQVFSIGEEKGLFYFAMEYIKGTSLADIKKEQGVLTPERAVPIIKQVADALGHAHQAGLVHRDIKPSNIMIDSQNKAKVTDFGIAFVLSAETKLTREGSIIGTPEYLSPEQCEGRIVDARSDIYSLGVTFYELLTGKTPYEADTPVSMLMKIVKGTFPPMCEVNPSVPLSLCGIVEKMMKTDPKQRYASMEEVLKDLEATGIGVSPVVSPKTEPSIEILAPQSPRLFEVAAEAPAPAAVAPAASSNKRAALIVVAIIVLLMGGAFAAKMIFEGKKTEPKTAEVADPTGANPVNPLFDAAQKSADTSTPAPQAGGDVENTAENSFASADPENQETGDGESDGPESKTFAEAGEAGKRLPGTTVSAPPAGGDVREGRVSGDSFATSSPPPPQAPARSCVVKTTGDSDKSDLVNDYVEEVLGRRNYTVIDGPSVPGQKLAAIARNLIVVSVKQIGSTTLNYYGSSSEQYTVAITIKVVDPGKGTVVAGPASRTVKFTDLNAEENLKEALRALMNQVKL